MLNWIKTIFYVLLETIFCLVVWCPVTVVITLVLATSLLVLYPLSITQILLVLIELILPDRIADKVSKIRKYIEKISSKLDEKIFGFKSSSHGSTFHLWHDPYRP